MRRGVLLGGAGIAAMVAAALFWFGRAPAAPRQTVSGPTQLLDPSGRPAPIGITPAKAQAGAKGSVAVAGGWGGEPGQFGRRHDPESNPEAPMAVAAGPGGELAVVDQINRRVQRFRNGKLVGTVSFGGDTVQDLAMAPGGKTVLLDRLVDGNVQIYGQDGKLLNQVPIVGKNIDEGGDVTGVFADDDGIYVERQHGSIVRVAGPDGKSDPDRPELLGRPSRDGRWLLQAEIADQAAGSILVRATDRKTGDLAWVQTLKADAPLLHLVMLDSDRKGNVYAAVEVARESADFEPVDAHIVAFRLSGSGAQTGMLRLPPLTSADETFRPMTVDDDGVIYLMLAGDTGLKVLRYSF